MDALYEWIRNITFYLIFITVVTGLLPDKKYEKYFRLFAGMVLILLVIKPFTSGLRLEDQLSYYFESISFQKEAGELKEALSGMEEQRLDQMIAQYEEAVEMDLKSMAASAEFGCVEADAVIEKDSDKDNFGTVTGIRMVLTLNPYEGLVGDSTAIKIAGAMDTEPVVQVENVQIGIDMGTDENDDLAEDNSVVLRQKRKQQEEENQRTGSLKRRIAEYYDLEEQDIEIQLEDE